MVGQLQVDMKQDRERKILGIRHRLESELAETLPISSGWEEIDALIAAAWWDSDAYAAALPVPAKIGLTHLLAAGPQAATKILAVGSPTINLNPQIINTVHGVVAHEILGNVTLSNEDEKLLKLIKEHAGEKSIELTSAVYQLSDLSVPKTTRLVSAQRLKAFLWVIAKKIEDVASHVLQSYIERKLGLK